jgi:hypothetical protein
MLKAVRKPIRQIDNCPHCSSNFVTWDELENEPYCYICGWRQSIRITREQGRNNFSTERAFWINLFAGEKDPAEIDASESSPVSGLNHI